MKRTPTDPGATPSPDQPVTARKRSPYSLDLVQRVSASNRMKTFIKAINRAGLGPFLKGRGPFTLFAPTDEAFDKLPQDERDALLADPTRLAEVVARHVVTARVKAPQTGSPRLAMPMYGQHLTIARSAAGFTVDDAKLVKTGIRTSNGVIHAIDTVLAVR
jgi:uncharacterized surface protein with fasciclin (FAS1) repeats